MINVDSLGSFSAKRFKCSSLTDRRDKSIEVRLVMAAMALMALGLTTSSKCGDEPEVAEVVTSDELS